MPLYEYQCSKCDKVFEVIEKFADAPLTVHEGCGGHVERLLSAPAFQLKGTGWYATDYAKSGAKPTPGSESKSTDSKDGESKATDSKSTESKSSDEKSSADKTEKKTETETESKPAPAKTE